MKCRICGHRSNSLPAMGKHFRQKHPGAMKRRIAVPKKGPPRPGLWQPSLADGGTWHPAGCRCQGCK
jgi:hypothetical protein